jgi:hypothetical protein
LNKTTNGPKSVDSFLKVKKVKQKKLESGRTADSVVDGTVATEREVKDDNQEHTYSNCTVSKL